MGTGLTALSLSGKTRGKKEGKCKRVGDREKSEEAKAASHHVRPSIDRRKKGEKPIIGKRKTGLGLRAKGNFFTRRGGGIFCSEPKEKREGSF